MGLIGVCGIIIIYTLVLYAGFRLALDCSDRFATYLAAGITSVLGVQVMVNVGVVMGLLPTKGLTLPLISYGGSSVVVTMASIGILMNISGTQRMGRRGK